MKLFSRTLLFFTSVVFFQTALTVFLVDNIITRNNRQDARAELKVEAAAAYDTFNSWKRGLWKSLIRIAEDTETAAILAGERGGVPGAFEARLRRLFVASGFDSLYVKQLYGQPSAVESGDLFIPVTVESGERPEQSLLFREAVHPTVRLHLLAGRPYLIGSLTLPFSVPALTPAAASRGLSSGVPTEPSGVEIYILKSIEGEFLKQLVLYSRAEVSLVLGDRTVAGGFDAGRILPLERFPFLESAYREFTALPLERDEYDVAVQKLGPIARDPRGRELYLVTALSSAPYQQRVFVVGRTVFSVSLVSALLAIAMSLFFSRNISHPVRNLLTAMRRVQEGAYNTLVPVVSGRELGELILGFNEMASTIHQDKLTMERYIEEITILKEYNEKILHSLRAGIAIVDTQLRLEKANQSFLELFSLTEAAAVGRRIDSLALPIVDDTLLETIARVHSGEEDTFAVVRRCPGKRVYEVRLYPFIDPENRLHGIAGCILTVDDISSKVELEEKIFQAEKLSSVSMLSAGVAHEINNPLGSIMTNVQNLIAEENDVEKTVSLRWIEQETRRIAGIVRDLLEFASRDTDPSPRCDVNHVATDVIRLVSYSFGKSPKADIGTDLCADLPPARIGKDELTQVLMNLVKNALHAVGEDGKVVIGTGHSADGKSIQIHVEDNGHGMKPELISSIFDPFFTTKKNGEGTGLGLSVVYGIMNKYGGTIGVKSREGEGSTFTLTLPRGE